MQGDMSVVGIVPARLDSARLPGKVLREVAGRPLIGYVLERARRVRGLQAVAVATTDRACDEPLVGYAQAQGVAVLRGDTEDVAGRFLAAAEVFGADYLVRMNGDSPFLDPRLVEEGIAALASGADFVTNLPDRTFPYGIAVEIVRAAALRELHPRMTPEDREHVTRYLYEHRTGLRVRELRSPHAELAPARLVVDTEDDLGVFRTLVERLGERALSAGYAATARLRLEVS